MFLETRCIFHNSEKYTKELHIPKGGLLKIF